MKSNNLILILIAIAIPIALVRECNYKSKLESNTLEVHGFFMSRSLMAKTCRQSTFKYTVEGKYYEVTLCGLYEHLSVDDTVLLKYSNENPEICEISNSRYMKKHQ